MQRYPVHTGRLHRRRTDTASLQPVGQQVEIPCECRKAAYRFFIAVRGNSDEYLAGPNIDSGGIGMQDCQVLNSFLSLCRHFVLPVIPGRMPMVRSEANSQSRSSPYANVITKLYAT